SARLKPCPSRMCYVPAASLAGIQYTSSFRCSLVKPIRFRMLLPFSIMSGCPHRYATEFVPSSSHLSEYFRMTSSTRPISPIHFSSSHGRLTEGTYFSHGTSAAILQSSSQYPNSHDRLAPFRANSLCSPLNVPSFHARCKVRA